MDVMNLLSLLDATMTNYSMTMEYKNRRYIEKSAAVYGETTQIEEEQKVRCMFQNSSDDSFDCSHKKW